MAKHTKLIQDSKLIGCTCGYTPPGRSTDNYAVGMHISRANKREAITEEKVDWPHVVEIVLSAEIGGRRVNVAHAEQAEAAAKAAFVTSLTSCQPAYTVENVQARARYLYVGLDTAASS
jgi:hypothetical protein